MSWDASYSNRTTVRSKTDEIFVWGIMFIFSDRVFFLKSCKLLYLDYVLLTINNNGPLTSPQGDVLILFIDTENKTTTPAINYNDIIAKCFRNMMHTMYEVKMKILNLLQHIGQSNKIYTNRRYFLKY